jgi:hypothetical protein
MATYALTLDMWLGMNGFRLPEFNAVFAQAQPLNPHISEANEVLLHYFPEQLHRHRHSLRCQRPFLPP